MDRYAVIRDAAALTPDPARALKNLERVPHEILADLDTDKVSAVARLFAFSQFLADYCVTHPEELRLALLTPGKALLKSEILSVMRAGMASIPLSPANRYREETMRFLRAKKKRYLLGITLRDIQEVSNLEDCMKDLTSLAEAFTELALEVAGALMREKFGLMTGNEFTVMGLGKLGAGELNYSSDIDLITLYRFNGRFSSGVLTPFGIRTNKIDSREYFSRLTESMATLLQSPTEDGIVYRVDLRLRPNGQKGDLSLSLDSAVSYYESWGKTWERIALMRARAVAGDFLLGEVFLGRVDPFIWKRSAEYNDISEIRELKKKIDRLSDINDIKRGYGGIREIEFFVQTFQLLYGGEKRDLREPGLLAAISRLREEVLILPGDAATLREAYLFLRRIEHLLQMRDDLRTHLLPHDEKELQVLSDKMSYVTLPAFLLKLRMQRLKVRDMYNSLLGGSPDEREDLLSLAEGLPREAIIEYLSFKGFEDPEFSLKQIEALTEQITSGKTLRERTTLRKVVPLFLESITHSVNKSKALSMLVNFIRRIGEHEAYLDLLTERTGTREVIISAFSKTTYLGRLLLNLENIEGIFEFPDIRIDYRVLEERILSILMQSDPSNALRDFKMSEEMKTGLLYLNGSTDVYALCRALSMLADVIIRAIIRKMRIRRDFAVIGAGGFGAWDLNFGSDLDLLFVGLPSEERRGEEIMKFLSEYKSKGFAYRVDMRLRPDGSKGVLVTDMAGYEDYYLKSAQPWEIQSLIRARPVAGDAVILRSFRNMRRRVIISRAGEITADVMRSMRARIISEVSKERVGIDVRNGPGGTKEIDFLVQYLQIKNATRYRDLLAENTIVAVNRLIRHGVVDAPLGDALLRAHRFLKIIDTALRLNEEDVLKTDSSIPDIIKEFLHLPARDEVIKSVADTRETVREIAGKLYESQGE